MALSVPRKAPNHGLPRAISAFSPARFCVVYVLGFYDFLSSNGLCFPPLWPNGRNPQKKTQIGDHALRQKLKKEDALLFLLTVNRWHAEVWDPVTEEFTLMESEHKIARTYHSTAVLIPDGRVFTGGGGLCGSCTVNHLDMEIYNPYYLFNPDGSRAQRPNITVSAQTATLGSVLTVGSDTPLDMISMIRMGSATHSTNTDQRRIELCGLSTNLCGPLPVNVTIPGTPGIATAGYWMIFGLNSRGVPSVASIVHVT
jgi:hypothetical protein